MKPIKDKFIILYNPQPTKVSRTVMPLGLLAISSYLEKDGYNIRIYHSSEKKSYLKVLDHLDQAICVGITSMTGYQIFDGLNFAQLVRKKSKNIPIVWGGIHPTIEPLSTIKHPLVDIVVRDQGEETFYELVNALERKSDLANIPGIYYKKDGKIIKNIPRQTKSINEFPPLPYHLLGNKIENYITRSNHYAKRQAPIITSNGCPFMCNFCFLSTPEFRKKWGAYPPERVVGEIEYLVKNYNLTGIDIKDSNFFVDKERARQIFQKIIDKKINIAITGVNGRVDQLVGFDDEYWRLMETAGVKELLVGAESGDQEMLDLINKGITPEVILACERKAAKYNINIVNSLMTNYPPATDDPIQIKKVQERELKNTVNLASKMLEINPLTNIMLFSYAPYPGTPLYQLSIKRGFKDPQTLEGWGKIDLNSQILPWVDRKRKDLVVFLNNLFILKKITSIKYFNSKQNKKIKDYILIFSGFCLLFNQWITLRLKYKFYFFPFENFLFSLNIKMYHNSIKSKLIKINKRKYENNSNYSN